MWSSTSHSPLQYAASPTAASTETASQQQLEPPLASLPPSASSTPRLPSLGKSPSSSGVALNASSNTQSPPSSAAATNNDDSGKITVQWCEWGGLLDTKDAMYSEHLKLNFLTIASGILFLSAGTPREKVIRSFCSFPESQFSDVAPPVSCSTVGPHRSDFLCGGILPPSPPSPPPPLGRGFVPHVRF